MGETEEEEEWERNMSKKEELHKNNSPLMKLKKKYEKKQNKYRNFRTQKIN